MELAFTNRATELWELDEAAKAGGMLVLFGIRIIFPNHRALARMRETVCGRPMFVHIILLSG